MLINFYHPYWVNMSELEHHGILGQKWGIRRYQNKDGTLTAAGRARLEKPKTSAEKWKYKQIRQIDKLYEKSYKKLNKAYSEDSSDSSIIKYKKQLESQHEKDRKAIENMSFVEVEKARETEKAENKAARDRTIKKASSAALWGAKMALIGVRIGGTVAVLNVLSDVGRTGMDYLTSPEGQKLIKAGSTIITKVGNGEFTALNLTKEFFSTKASGSIMDRALSQIDVSGVTAGANYIPPNQMDKLLKDSIKVRKV